MPHEDSPSMAHDQAGTLEDGSVSERAEKTQIAGPAMETRAEVTEDGRISIKILAKQAMPVLPSQWARAVMRYGVDPARPLKVPKLQIVIFIVGSRGDVQPYLALALQMVAQHGHRVRIATHDTFKSFVLEHAKSLQGGADAQGRPLASLLEFYGIGGDPKDLMAYMVNNPGLLPGIQSLTNGDIKRKKKMVKTMLQNFYQSTFSPCPETGTPFAVDAIISNPPAFAHIHIAEALAIPLTMSFTMPWSATTAFSHPLVAVSGTNTSRDMTNYLTFALAEALTWEGLGGVINHFREKKLALDRLTIATGASLLDRLKIPYIYCWSSNLIPKPKDWMDHIDITGFLFLPNQTFRPDPKLAAFLAAGPPPMYIGFGSIVVKDPTALTTILLGAIARCNVRVLLSAGWSDLGASEIPENVFLLGDCPHDWLFAEGRVSAVCIHGGAGTTAIALRNGLPIIVVPFFGDQPFWGACIAKQGAGPDPIPFKQLTVDNLSDAFRIALSAKTRTAAKRMGESIRNEDGPSSFIAAFHAHLPLLHMRCEIESSLVAVWWSPEYVLRLSGKVAAVLVAEGKLKYSGLEPWRPTAYDTHRVPPGPFSGGAFGFLKGVSEFGDGFTHIFSSRPQEGLVMLASAVPATFIMALAGFAEGLEHLPQLYGTKERHYRGRVRNIRSGCTAGAKALAFGFYDGLTGVINEPRAGARHNGVSGFAAGLARGIANLVVQPVAGIVGFVSYPIQGIGKSFRRAIGDAHPEFVLAKPREELGQQALHEVSNEERSAIVEAFAELSGKTKERRQAIKAEAETWMSATREAESSNIQQPSG